MKRLPVLALLLVAPVALVDCTSDLGTESDAGSGASVFDVPKSNANSNVLFGVWETTTPTKEPPYSSSARFELRADHLISATRCTADDGSAQPVTVSVRVAATITSSLISVKESAKTSERIGSAGVCGVQMSAGLLPACEAAVPAASRTACFALTGGQLVIYQTVGALEMTKIAD
jgi:hypothetical protein